MTVAEKAALIIKDIKKETGINPVTIFKNIAKNDYVNEHYNVSMEYEKMKCEYSKINEQCIKERCPYYE